MLTVTSFRKLQNGSKAEYGGETMCTRLNKSVGRVIFFKFRAPFTNATVDKKCNQHRHCLLLNSKFETPNQSMPYLFDELHKRRKITRSSAAAEMPRYA